MFEGLSRFTDPYKISTKSEVEPVIQPPRRVPMNLHAWLSGKLNEMERDSIIVKVDSPTDWVHNIVVVENKNGDRRICLDLKDLIQAIRREHFQIPTYEDVVSRLASKRFFTILDQKDSFWQAELDEDSSHMCSYDS